MYEPKRTNTTSRRMRAAERAKRAGRVFLGEKTATPEVVEDTEAKSTDMEVGEERYLSERVREEERNAKRAMRSHEGQATSTKMMVCSTTEEHGKQREGEKCVMGSSKDRSTSTHSEDNTDVRGKADGRQARSEKIRHDEVRGTKKADPEEMRGGKRVGNGVREDRTGRKARASDMAVRV